MYPFPYREGTGTLFFMRSFDEAYAGARERSAFSNGTEGECWMDNWCARCVNDSPEMVDRGEGCPLILVALSGRTPTEWIEQNPLSLSDRYHCIEFRGEDEGGDPPPPPPIPGQGELIPAEPFEGVRMFADVVAEARREEVSR